MTAVSQASLRNVVDLTLVALYIAVATALVSVPVVLVVIAGEHAAEILGVGPDLVGRARHRAPRLALPGGRRGARDRRPAADARVSDSDDLRAATDPSTEPDRLLVLAAARRVEVRAAVARNPATPAAAIRWLVADKNPGVRHAAVESGRREAWEAAVISDNEVTRVVLGQQPGLDEDIIAALVSDPAVHVRRQVAYGTESRAALEALLDDPVAAVKAEAVRNRHLLPADAQRLAADPDPVVRAAVARSPMTPVALSKAWSATVTGGSAAAPSPACHSHRRSAPTCTSSANGCGTWRSNATCCPSTPAPSGTRSAGGSGSTSDPPGRGTSP